MIIAMVVFAVVCVATVYAALCVASDADDDMGAD